MFFFSFLYRVKLKKPCKKIIGSSSSNRVIPKLCKKKNGYIIHISFDGLLYIFLKENFAIIVCTVWFSSKKLTVFLFSDYSSIKYLDFIESPQGKSSGRWVFLAKVKLTLWYSNEGHRDVIGKSLLYQKTRMDMLKNMRTKKKLNTYIDIE